MSPPIVFSDIGKAASDLLSKDFPTGSIRLETKTTASNGVNFTVSGTKDNKSGGIIGELKTKYSDKSKGLTLTETWTTANVLSAEVELVDSITNGLKLNLVGSLLPHSGTKNAKINMEFKKDRFTTRSSLDLLKGPVALADVAFNHEGFMAGAESSYDLKSGQVPKYNFVVGYATREYSTAFHIGNKMETYMGSYFHKVNKDLEACGRATWDRKAGANVNLELGAKYLLDKDTSLKAKMDNSGKLGIGYSQVLRPGIKVTLGGMFDTTRLGENVHKVGLAMVLDA